MTLPIFALFIAILNTDGSYTTRVTTDLTQAQCERAAVQVVKRIDQPASALCVEG